MIHHTIVEESIEPPNKPEDTYNSGGDTLLYQWGDYADKHFEENLHLVYEKIVYWRKNLFLLPTGKAGKQYIDEITRLINAWVADSPLKKIAFKAIMVMPSLLLQKPSKDSKSKDHLLALERRFKLWSSGNLLDLLKESQTIQDGLKSLSKPKTIGELSKKFAEQMQKGNVNGAIKLLTNNMQNGILPLNKETIALLKQKHPHASKATQEVLLPDQPESIHPIKFEKINADVIRAAVTKTRGGSGPSGMDAEGWKRLLTSNSFGQSSQDLCKAVAAAARKLCTVPDQCGSLEAFLACRLIPLDKNPGLRPIGVGEILRRIVGKAIVNVIRNDILTSVGSLQVCAGHEAGCEAAVHAMHQIFDQEDTEAILLIDAANAFNCVNRNVFLHNIGIVCPEMAIYVKNCYYLPSRLFIIGGYEIKSSEGTTQGDPIAMAIYAIAIIPLIMMIIEATSHLPSTRTRVVAYADDFSAAGSVENLVYWWQTLCDLGPKFGYYPQASKSWLIVKPTVMTKAKRMFEGTHIQITQNGKRHLGAIVGSLAYRNEFLSEKVNRWYNEIRLLSEIARIEPQAAYSCFVSGYKHKFTYCMRTIPNIGDLLKPIDEIILTKFIPAITGGIVINDLERKLISLPVKYGGLGLPVYSELSDREYENSILITEHLRNNIIQQVRQYCHDPDINKKKNKLKVDRAVSQKKVLDATRQKMNEQQIRLNNINQEMGASNWLTTLPLKDEGYTINKQCFWDLIRLRYGWELSRLPDNCECGSKFTTTHALSCKKGGFISIRHNQIRNITASLLKEVCRDVRVEPTLQPLSGEYLEERMANESNEARVDVSARGFWISGQMAFFDVRVFNPSAKRYENQETAKTYDTNEKEKKKQYNDRIMQVEHGTFTPLVMSATGGMGRECRKFYARLAEMISEKRKQSYPLIVSWIRRKLCFALLNSVCLCIRGSRTIFHSNLEESISEDPKVSEITSRIE